MIWSWLATRAGKLAALLVITGSAVLTFIRLIRRNENLKDEIDELEDYKETRDRIDEVRPSDNVSDAITRLRRNGWLR